MTLPTLCDMLQSSFAVIIVALVGFSTCVASATAVFVARELGPLARWRKRDK